MSSIPRTSIAITSLAACSFWLAPNALAADGDLELGFGIGGHVLIGPILNPNVQFNKIETLAFDDGSVLIAGADPHRLRKFLATGQPDNGFGTNGETVVPNAPLTGQLGMGMTIAPNGDIYSLAAVIDGNTSGAVVCRYGANGQPLDFTGLNSPCAVATFNFDFFPVELTVDVDGGLIVMDQLNGAFIRFFANGTADLGFAPQGAYFLPGLDGLIVPGQHRFDAMIVRNGQIFLAGTGQALGGEATGIVAKLVYQPNQEPSLDANFNAGAPILVACGAPNEDCAIRDMIWSRGQLVTAGMGDNGAEVAGIVSRFDPVSGSMIGQPSLLSVLGNSQNVQLLGLAAEPNGDVIVVGSAAQLLPPSLAVVARVKLGCTPPLDIAGFGAPNGWIALPGIIMDTAYAVAIGNDRIYVGGISGLLPGTRTEVISAVENSQAYTDSIFTDGFDPPCE